MGNGGTALGVRGMPLRLLVVVGCVVVWASLLLVWVEIPTFLDWPWPFAGYQVTFLGPAIAAAAIVAVAEAALDRPKVIVASGAAIVGMAGSFLGLPGPFIRETWRWSTGGFECAERCLAPEFGYGALVAIVGGTLAVLGGLLRWRQRASPISEVGPLPSAPA